MQEKEKPIMDKGINDIKPVYTTGNIAPSCEVFEKKHLDNFIKKVSK